MADAVLPAAHPGGEVLPLYGARAALAEMVQYEPTVSADIWRTRTMENRAEVVLRRVPMRLEALATLLQQLTVGPQSERMPALWLLQDLLKAEARALRVAVVAVDSDDEGFIARPSVKGKGVRRKRA